MKGETMTWGLVLIVLAVVALPLVAVAVDAVAGIRARGRDFTFGNQGCSDFEVLVPIYGNIRYLENVDYLSAYGAKVLLCTTRGETAEFYEGLYRIASRHGFRVFVAQFGRADNLNKRATSGTIRDRLIRDALPLVRAAYVVPVDADTTTAKPLDLLVGELKRRRLDIASIRLVASNADSVLAKLQGLEYRVAMQFRFLAPWLISGACHVAETAVLADVMRRHSLFFQGNDVEVGLIARARGYQVGHIPFEVPTTVPSTARAWFRQRLAWSGGEFRLFIMNIRFIVRSPFFWLYGAVVTIAAFPLRWMVFTEISAAPIICTALAVAAVAYVALVAFLHWKHRGPLLMLMPFYLLFTSMIMVPLGAAWYIWMAAKDRNLGIINPHRTAHIAPAGDNPAAWVKDYI
jgi:Glycosyl transferase family group 2